MSREEAVRAAAEALRDIHPCRDWRPHRKEAAAAVDAAAPHLNADLVRERDEALAEVERLRGAAAVVDGDRNLWRTRAEKAEAAIARVEVLATRWEHDTWHKPSAPEAAKRLRAALRGDQP